jgi:hypothetical protein
MTKLAFGIGQTMFSITRKWNKQGDKAVVKDVTLKMINTDGKKQLYTRKSRSR